MGLSDDPIGNGATDKSRRGIQVIARAAAILRTLERDPSGLSLGRIAEAVGLARSTVQRIVEALAVEGIVVPASRNGGVRLGPALVRLADSAQHDMAATARPLITDLSRKLGETVDLAVLRGDRMVFVDQIVGTHRLRAVSAVGETFPLYCSANGKACLARLPKTEARELVDGRMVPFTEHTLSTFERLEGELDEIRRTGIAFDREEHSSGICAVGAAVRNPAGMLLAVSIPVPAQRFYGDEEHLAAALRATARRLEETLSPRPLQTTSNEPYDAVSPTRTGRR